MSWCETSLSLSLLISRGVVMLRGTSPFAVLCGPLPPPLLGGRLLAIWHGQVCVTPFCCVDCAQSTVLVVVLIREYSQLKQINWKKTRPDVPNTGKKRSPTQKRKQEAPFLFVGAVHCTNLCRCLSFTEALNKSVKVRCFRSGSKETSPQSTGTLIP